MEYMMIKFINLIIILTLCAITPIYAIEESTITEIEQSVDELHKKVTKFADVILSSEQRSALEILSDYHSSKSKLIQQWLLIAYQKNASGSRLLSSDTQDKDQYDQSKAISHFVNNSWRRIISYLEQLNFDEQQGLTIKDYSAIREQINKVIDSSQKYPEIALNKISLAESNVYIRKLPIHSDLTKQRNTQNAFIILKKNKRFKLIYKIKFQTPDEYSNIWGYIETEDRDQYGWVNLRYALHSYKIIGKRSFLVEKNFEARNYLTASVNTIRSKSTVIYDKEDRDEVFFYHNNTYYRVHKTRWESHCMLVY
jgi:hypothetical protein